MTVQTPTRVSGVILALALVVGLAVLARPITDDTNSRSGLTLTAKWRAGKVLTTSSRYANDNPLLAVRISWNVNGAAGETQPEPKDVRPVPPHDWQWTKTFPSYNGGPASMRITMLHANGRVLCQMRTPAKTLDTGQGPRTIGCSFPPPAPGTRT